MPRRTSWFRLAICGALPFAVAQACGPDFFPDTFVRTYRPDLPKQFVAGRLGILQTGFARADLFVAYRYLSGGTLDATEQKAWSPTASLAEQYFGTPVQPTVTVNSTPAETPLQQWTTARSRYPGGPAVPIEQNGKLKVKSGTYEYDEPYLNCADDAFRTATATLQARAATWGGSSPALSDWLRGQDAVFSNCAGGGTVPAAAAAGSPALLVQDRAYQVAAAHFYSGAFAAAVAEFNAIGNDAASPWRPLGGYLAARTLVRQAFFARPSTNEGTSFDPAGMRSAGDRLDAYLSTKPPAALRQAAEAQLALVRIRIEPDARMKELADLVAGPGHDANYAQDLQDLLWIANAKTPDGLRKQPEPWAQVDDAAHPGQKRTATEQETKDLAIAVRQQTYQATKPERDSAPILDWALTFQSLAPDAAVHATAQWRATHALPWLVAALALAPDGAKPPDDLLQAAAAVSETSPAWQTVSYHRARLLLAAGRAAEARAALAAFNAAFETIPQTEREPSTINAVRGLGMLASDSVSGFLRHATRTMLLQTSEEAGSARECAEAMKDPKRHYACVASVDPAQLDADAAGALNSQSPLSVWLVAAADESLPAQLRSAIAAEGWTRAVLLDDRRRAADFLPLLPATLREQATESTPLAQWMTLARNPGLRPYLNAGTQRAYSFDFVESYRDNWCYKPEELPSAPPPAFLPAAEKQQGQAEAQRLAEVRSLTVGRRIAGAVAANPADPQSAEALFLVLRMIRYGCTEPAPAKPDQYQAMLSFSQEAKDLLALKLEASRLLRKYYATSPWTKRAAPFAG